MIADILTFLFILGAGFVLGWFTGIFTYPFLDKPSKPNKP